MKAKLTFNLPEDNYDYRIANNASKYLYILEELDGWMRNQSKYNSDGLNNDEREGINRAREYLHSLLKDNDIDLYNI